MDFKIVRPGHLYDGNRETAVSHQMGILHHLQARPLIFCEGEGRLDRPVKAVKGHENRQSTTGTRRFGPHIDHATARFPWEPEDGRHSQPDWLLLTTIHNPDQVGTWFADPEDVYNQVLIADRETAITLERPEASLPTPPGVQPPRIATNIPLVVRDQHGCPAIRAYPRTIAETDAMEHALGVLSSVLDDQSLWTEVALAPGEAVVARGTMLHKRRAISAERELTAMYGRDNTRNSGAVCRAYPYLEAV